MVETLNGRSALQSSNWDIRCSITRPTWLLFVRERERERNRRRSACVVRGSFGTIIKDSFPLNEPNTLDSRSSLDRRARVWFSFNIFISSILPSLRCHRCELIFQLIWNLISALLCFERTEFEESSPSPPGLHPPDHGANWVFVNLITSTLY